MAAPVYQVQDIKSSILLNNMPKSKRNKIVHLTQVKKKGKDHKEDLMKQVEQYIAQFKRVFIFDFDQTKSDRIMNLRLKLKDIGRIFAGRNSLVSLTLKQVGTKTNTDFDELIQQVAGHRGLLFTDISSEKLMDLLDKEVPEFCEKLLGYSQIAPETVVMDVVEGDTNEGATGKKKKKAKAKKMTSDGKRAVKFVKV